MEMIYTEVAPPARLTPWVAAFWSFEVAPSAGELMHSVPLTGGVILTTSGSEVYLVGPRCTPLVVPVRGGDVHRGVHLLPGASTSLFGVAGKRWRDAQLPARFALRPEFCERLTGCSTNDQFLASAIAAFDDHAVDATPPDPLVSGVVQRILSSNGAASIASISEGFGVSPRQLRRRFVEQVGLSPKELARIIRLRSAATAAVVHHEPWVDVAAGHGYADQPHLVREFRSLLGSTPQDFGAHGRKIRHRGRAFE